MVIVFTLIPAFMIPAGIQASAKVLYALLFFNGVSVILTSFVGWLAFMEMKIDDSAIRIKSFMYDRTILLEEIVSWHHRSKTSKFLNLNLQSLHRMEMNLWIWEKQDEVTAHLRKILETKPINPKRYVGRVSFQSGVLIALGLIYLVATLFLAFGESALLFIGFIAFNLAVVLYSFYRNETYIEDGDLVVSSSMRYKLSKVRDIIEGDFPELGRGAKILFGYDTVFVAKDRRHYEEVVVELKKSLAENKALPGYKAPPSYWG